MRKNNARTTVKAFLCAVGLLSILVITPWLIHVLSKTNPVAGNNEQIKIIEVNLLSRIKELKPVIKPITKAPSKPVQHKSIQYSKMNIVPENQTESDIPTQEQLHEAVISTTNSNGEESLNLNPIEIQEETSNTTGSSAPADIMELHTLDGIENYPEFPGGHSAFIKFLSRNLKYPETAVEKGIEGKVLISFIIEKNGRLSNIKILRGIGYGCDEEAIRVLEKSPEWKPGIQNKQKVRVAYTLPINFSLP
ncbi:MAG: energy transducer TonB [Daejeonella sp.]|nr:energy transducer TonB [Daejeonella sp.]